MNRTEGLEKHMRRQRFLGKIVEIIYDEENGDDLTYADILEIMKKFIQDCEAK
jgi:ethanolamine utilization protein EutA (predicted chaperonin)